MPGRPRYTEHMDPSRGKGVPMNRYAVPLNTDDHLVNPEGIKLAAAALASYRRPGLHKAAFIPGGDPSMMGAGGGGGAPPPGGDPSGGAGGAPPPGGMDPSMMMGAGGGGDPSGGAGGGMPPPPPPSGGGDMGAITAKLD